MLERLDALKSTFGGRLGISYAVKANPNRALLAALDGLVDGFDVSSIGEAERVGEAAARTPMTFTGPGKRTDELRRFARLGLGHVVLESLDEAEDLSRIVAGEGLPAQRVLLRINPRQVPRGFGAIMAGRASQFGICEEDLAQVLAQVARLQGLELIGFHCFAATGGLKAEPVAANLAAMAELFSRSAGLARIRPQMAIFGAGFGIPYHAGEYDLDLTEAAALACPALDTLRAEPAFTDTRFVLELGRWLVGPAGYLLTTVVRSKTSRGVEIRVCDAGFNVHMAACGMLGGAFRRNWPIVNLSNPEGTPEIYDLVGPLCTSLDHIATAVNLPAVRTGDVLAILQSGAYGPTASPGRFISHPEPREFLLIEGRMVDVSERPPHAPASSPSPTLRPAA